MTWATAHQAANIAAAQAHFALGVVTTDPPVDVEDAIRSADVTLMTQPMPKLLGVYVNEPGARPGILVNSGLRLGARRQTAAHELGHHRFAHHTQVDSGIFVEIDEPEPGLGETPNRRGWPEHEKLAEAFAAWFLMPLAGVRVAMTRLGIEQFAGPEDVYRLSLILRTPFRTTVRHLPNLRLLHQGRAREWLTLAPGRIKARMDQGAVPPATRLGDVWQLQAGFDGSSLTLFAGDRVVLEGTSAVLELPTGIYPVPLKSPGSGRHQTAQVFECGSDMRSGSLSGADCDGHDWSIQVVAGVHSRGLNMGRKLATESSRSDDPGE